MLAMLLFSNRDWLWPAAGGLAAALVLLLWMYRAAPPLCRWLCPILKWLGLAALVVCLLEPLWSGRHARPGANLFAIVADNSEGLRIKDRGASRSRGDELRQILDLHHGNWQQTLADNFDVRRYLFDARLQTTADFGELAFDGQASAIGGALRALAERYHARPLAGILLLTDGNATDLTAAPGVPGLPPVYPVLLGSRDPVRDIAVQQLHSTQTDFEDAPVTVQAGVTAAGFRGEAISARLVDGSGRVAAEQTARARTDNDTLAFRFPLRPDEPGLLFYRLEVRAAAELGATNPGSQTQEATLANNHGTLAVDRGRGPYRILYVSGRPNWEFKFLNRAVQEDAQLQLVALIRVARREPRFQFLGRPGETSNPLYRGFENQSAEEIERYDQPVLVRLNTRDEFELRGGFPHAPEELYAYHAVILDDLEAEFFTPDQMGLLQKFVAERGGGFLMLGGMESFQQGKFHRTPIGDLLPVYLDPAEPDGAVRGPFQLNLTREGWLQPWARLRDNEADDRQRLRSMPPFQVLNRVRDLKPGATPIAAVTDTAGRSAPALAVQRFGRGHAGALLIGDFWQWGFHDADAHRDMDKAWRQMMRWLVNDVPGRVQVTAERQPESGPGAVRLQVRVRDAQFQPLDNALVTLQTEPVMADPNAVTRPMHLDVAPSSREPGLYEATFVPRRHGGYQASVSVTNAEGAEVGRAATGWSADLISEEYRSLTPNAALLEAIARHTGGEMVDRANLDAFAAGLPRRHAPVMESWSYPLWHTPALFGFALACLAIEWGVRRWKGMP